MLMGERGEGGRGGEGGGGRGRERRGGRGREREGEEGREGRERRGGRGRERRGREREGEGGRGGGGRGGEEGREGRERRGGRGRERRGGRGREREGEEGEGEGGRGGEGGEGEGGRGGEGGEGVSHPHFTNPPPHCCSCQERHTFWSKHNVRTIWFTSVVHLLPPRPGPSSQQHLYDSALVDVVVDKFPALTHRETRRSICCLDRPHTTKDHHTRACFRSILLFKKTLTT